MNKPSVQAQSGPRRAFRPEQSMWDLLFLKRCSGSIVFCHVAGGVKLQKRRKCSPATILGLRLQSGKIDTTKHMVSKYGLIGNIMPPGARCNNYGEYLYYINSIWQIQLRAWQSQMLKRELWRRLGLFSTIASRCVLCVLDINFFYVYSLFSIARAEWVLGCVFKCCL